MKAFVRRVGCAAAYHTGLVRAALALTDPENAASGDRAFQILVYHRVGHDVDDFLPGVAVDAFAEQMRWLADNFHVLSLSALLTAARERAVPPRAVAVTFDDGYEDTLIHALPILRRHRIPATVYLTTQVIDLAAPMWNDRVGFAIRNTDRRTLAGVPGSEPLSLESESARRQALTRALQTCKRLPPRERDHLTAAIATELGVRTDAAPKMLAWSQVRELQAAGIDLGAHTVHHPILTTVSLAEARSEIVESKRAIEARLQAPVRHFAYPNGLPTDFDDDTKRCVREAGFDSAASMIFGSNTSATDPYALRRGGAWDPQPSAFATQLWWNAWAATRTERAIQ